METCKIMNPCRGICRQHEIYKICLGCYRTRLDIVNWLSASDKEKLKIISHAQQKAVIYGDLINVGKSSV